MVDRSIILTTDELEQMLERAARAGSAAALRDIGLHDEDAAGDVRELRGLLDAWREARVTAWRAIVKAVTTAALAALAAGMLLRFGLDK